MLLDVNDKPTPPPEAVLLDAARRRKGLSHRALGALVDLSDGRVRQVLNGYQTPGGGEYFPVSGKPEVIARLAMVLDVPRGELVEVGRGDAAEVLDRLTRSKPSGEGRPATLAGFTNDELLAEVRARMKGERGWGGSPGSEDQEGSGESGSSSASADSRRVRADLAMPVDVRVLVAELKGAEITSDGADRVYETLGDWAASEAALRDPLRRQARQAMLQYERLSADTIDQAARNLENDAG